MDEVLNELEQSASLHVSNYASNQGSYEDISIESVTITNRLKTTRRALFSQAIRQLATLLEASPNFDYEMNNWETRANGSIIVGSHKSFFTRVIHGAALKSQGMQATSSASAFLGYLKLQQLVGLWISQMDISDWTKHSNTSIKHFAEKCEAAICQKFVDWLIARRSAASPNEPDKPVAEEDEPSSSHSDVCSAPIAAKRGEVPKFTRMEKAQLGERLLCTWGGDKVIQNQRATECSPEPKKWISFLTEDVPAASVEGGLAGGNEETCKDGTHRLDEGRVAKGLVIEFPGLACHSINEATGKLNALVSCGERRGISGGNMGPADTDVDLWYSISSVDLRRLLKTCDTYLAESSILDLEKQRGGVTSGKIALCENLAKVKVKEKDVVALTATVSVSSSEESQRRYIEEFDKATDLSVVVDDNLEIEYLPDAQGDAERQVLLFNVVGSGSEGDKEFYLKDVTEVSTVDSEWDMDDVDIDYDKACAEGYYDEEGYFWWYNEDDRAYYFYDEVTSQFIATGETVGDDEGEQQYDNEEWTLYYDTVSDHYVYYGYQALLDIDNNYWYIYDEQTEEFAWLDEASNNAIMSGEVPSYDYLKDPEYVSWLESQGESCRGWCQDENGDWVQVDDEAPSTEPLELYDEDDPVTDMDSVKENKLPVPNKEVKKSNKEVRLRSMSFTQALKPPDLVLSINSKDNDVGIQKMVEKPQSLAKEGSTVFAIQNKLQLSKIHGDRQRDVGISLPLDTAKASETTVLKQACLKLNMMLKDTNEKEKYNAWTMHFRTRPNGSLRMNAPKRAVLSVMSGDVELKQLTPSTLSELSFALRELNLVQIALIRLMNQDKSTWDKSPIPEQRIFAIKADTRISDLVVQFAYFNYNREMLDPLDILLDNDNTKHPKMDDLYKNHKPVELRRVGQNILYIIGALALLDPAVGAKYIKNAWYRIPITHKKGGNVEPEDDSFYVQMPTLKGSFKVPDSSAEIYQLVIGAQRGPLYNWDICNWKRMTEDPVAGDPVAGDPVAGTKFE